MKLSKIVENYTFLLRRYFQYGKLVFVCKIIERVSMSVFGAIALTTVAQAVIDAVLAGEPFNSLLLIILRNFTILLAATLTQSFLRRFYSEPKETEVKQSLMRDLYAQVCQTDQRYFDDPKYRDTFQLAVEQYGGLCSSAADIVIGILSAFLGIGAMAAVMMRAGIVVIVLTVSGVLLSSWIGLKKINRLNTHIMKTIPLSRKENYIRSQYTGSETSMEIKTTRLHSFLDELFIKNSRDLVALIRRYNRQVCITEFLVFLSDNLTNYLVILYVAWGLVTGLVESVGVYSTLIMAATQLNSQLKVMLENISAVYGVATRAEQVRVFFLLKSEIESSLTGEAAPSGPLSVDVNNICFSYPDGTEVLKDFTMHILAGERVAIVGENGMGKSTLMKLLLRLYDVDQGEIKVSGKAISDYNIRDLRARIGIAFQQSNVYAISLSENLRLYSDLGTDAEKEALTKFGLKQLREKLELPLTKEFDENGIMLSGGEKQKLALARLFRGDFGLLLLDEPSSALDPLAEYELLQSLMTLAEGKTVVMVAHRLSTVRHMDRILVINEGRLVEEGTHEDLMAQNGIYADMFRKQSENYIA